MNDAPPPDSRPPQFHLWDAIALPSVTNALLAVVVALLLGSIAAAMVLGRAPLYRSNAILQIDQPQAIAASGDVGIIEKLNRLLPKYAALARTVRVVAPVSERTGVPAPEVAASVAVAPLGNTLLLSVAAQNNDRARANLIAQSVAEEVAAYADREQEANAIPADQRFHFTEIQAAGAGSKISPSKEDAIATGSVAALVGLAVAYVLLQVLSAHRRL